MLLPALFKEAVSKKTIDCFNLKRPLYLSKMKKYIFPLAVTLLLAACSGNPRKLLVLSNNNPEINEAEKTIVCKATTGHEEKTLDFNGDALKVSTAKGDATINTKEKGYYVINLKGNDTIIGSYQRFTTPEEAHRVMTQDDLKKKIDSLQQLVAGKNVSDANRNFFILPNTAAKITANTNAFVVAPFRPMTAAPETDDNTAPEVYQFYTIKEVRDIIAKLQKLTGPPPPPPATKK